MNLMSAKFWRPFTGFLVGVLLDVLAMAMLGMSKTFAGIPSSLQWIGIIALPPMGVVTLFQASGDLPGTVESLISGVMFLLTFGLYPIVLAVCFALPWRTKTGFSSIVAAIILLAVIVLGYVGLM